MYSHYTWEEFFDNYISQETMFDYFFPYEIKIMKSLF